MNKTLKPYTPLQETLEAIESTLRNYPSPLPITHLADLLGVTYSHIYSAIRRSDRTLVDFTTTLVDGKAQTAARTVPPSKEEPIKEHPHAELLRLAAEENNFEYYHEHRAEWRPISVNSLIIDTLIGNAFKWRVAPKLETITQWERRYFDDQSKLVKTLVSHSKESLDHGFHSPNSYWISEPNQTEYMVKI